MSILSEAIANALLSSGQISPETFGMMFPNQTEAPPAPSPLPVVQDSQVAPTEQPLPIPQVAPAPSQFPTEEDLAAIAQTETGGEANPDMAISEAGAIGRYQILPSTAADMAKRLGMNADTIDLHKPEINKLLGAEYLRFLNQKYQDPQLSRMAYHAGLGNVDKAIAETGSRDPNVIEEYFKNKGMPRSAAYADKVVANQESATGAPVQVAENATEDTMMDFEAPFKQQQLGKLEELTALKENQARAAEASANLNKIADEEIRRRATKEAQDNALMEDARKNYQAVEQEYLNTSVDPNRIYNKSSTGDKILAAIALAVGGFTAGYTGKENAVIGIINKAIENDIESQKIEVGKKSDASKNARSAYNDLVQRLGDQNQAQAAYAQLVYKKAENQLQAIIDNSKSIKDQGSALTLMGQLQQEGQKYALEMKQKAIEVGSSDEIKKAQKTGIVDFTRLSPDYQAKYVPGVGFATDVTQARKANEIKPAYENIKQMVSDMKALRDKFGGELAPPIVAQLTGQYENLKGQIAGALKEYYTLGAYDAGVERLNDQMLPSVAELTSFAPISRAGGLTADPYSMKIDSFISNLDRGFNKRMDSLVPMRIKQLDSVKSNTGINLGGK